MKMLIAGISGRWNYKAIFLIYALLLLQSEINECHFQKSWSREQSVPEKQTERASSPTAPSQF